MSKLAKRRRNRGLIGALTALILTGCPGGFNPAAAPPIPAANDGTRDELRRCVHLFQQKESAMEAKTCFEAASLKTREQPAELVAQFYLGRLSLRSGANARAFETLRLLAKRSLEEPLRTSVRYYLGLAAARQGKARVAKEQLAPLATTIDAQSRPALLAALASAEAHLGELEAAVAHLAQLHTLSDRPAERAYARATLSGLLQKSAIRQRWRALFTQANNQSLLRALLGQRLVQSALARGDIDGARDIERRCAPALHAHGIPSLLSGPASPAGKGSMVVWLPLSGSYSKMGRLALAGIAFASGAFATAPASGSPPLLVVDSAQPNAMAQLEELTRNPGVVGMVGGFSTTRTEALARLARAHNIPLVDLVSHPKGASKARYHVLPRPKDRAQQLARIAIARHPRAKAVILAPETPYGRRMSQAFARALAAGGGRLLKTSTYPPKTTNFSSRIKTISKLTPDVVFVPDRAMKLALIAPALGAGGLWAATPSQPGGKKITLVATADGLTAAQAKRWRRALSGAIIAPGFFPLADHALVLAYQRFSGRLPSLVEAYAHDAALSLLAPLRAGLGTPRALQQALNTRAVEGLTGKLRYELSGRRADPPQLYRVGPSGLEPYAMNSPKS
ncbi:MAG: penicillin-binding protein activator [Deltaproteobacteria bacterium]|nr:penicillin-binding protein activator [Deltaproteobacteria bacterium]